MICFKCLSKNMGDQEKLNVIWTRKPFLEMSETFKNKWRPRYTNLLIFPILFLCFFLFITLFTLTISKVLLTYWRSNDYIETSWRAVQANRSYESYTTAQIWWAQLLYLSADERRRHLRWRVVISSWLKWHCGERQLWRLFL